MLKKQETIETDRLVLRPFRESDGDNLFELDSDPAVMRFINGGYPTPRDVAHNEDLPWYVEYGQRAQGFGFWAAIEKATGDFLGWFFVRPQEDGSPNEPELGYRLRGAAWGKGYATEGSTALVDMGFHSASIERVVAFAIAGNLASQRVMRKIGMIPVRTYQYTWDDRFDGVEQELVEYAITRTEWDIRGERA